MFDHYSQMRDQTRKLAFLHPKTLTTWQDVVRANRDTNTDLRLESTLSKSLLLSILGITFVIVIGLSACTPSLTRPPAVTYVPTIQLSTLPPGTPPVPTSANMPNPASAFCEEQGYKLEIRTAADGSQSGACIFPDGSECDEWAYFRGECGPANRGGESSSAPTAIPTVQPIGPTGYQGWWTYTHPVYGFSIMLPDDWIVEEITTNNPLMNGHTLSLHPKEIAPDFVVGKEHIRMTFRRVGEDTRLWPTGVGQGEFIAQGTLEVAGQPAQRLLLVCPTGEVTSIWYHQAEGQPNILRGDLEFGYIFSAGSHCEAGYSLGGKVQRVGEMIIASLKVP